MVVSLTATSARARPDDHFYRMTTNQDALPLGRCSKNIILNGDNTLSTRHRRLRSKMDVFLRRAALPVHRSRGSAVGQLRSYHRIAGESKALFGDMRSKSSP